MLKFVVAISSLLIQFIALYSAQSGLFQQSTATLKFVFDINSLPIHFRASKTGTECLKARSDLRKAHAFMQ